MAQNEFGQGENNFSYFQRKCSLQLQDVVSFCFCCTKRLLEVQPFIATAAILFFLSLGLVVFQVMRTEPVLNAYYSIFVPLSLSLTYVFVCIDQSSSVCPIFAKWSLIDITLRLS